MNIEGMGDQTVERIRAQGSIPLASFADVYRLERYRSSLIDMRWNDTKAVARKGKPPEPPTKRVDNLLTAIAESKNRGLAKVLCGMGIRYVGEATAKALCKVVTDIHDLLDLPEPLLRPKSLSTIAAVEPLLHHPKRDLLGLNRKSPYRPETGLGEISAKVVHLYLHSEVASRTFAELKREGVDLSSHEFCVADKSDKPYIGRTFVITGTLETFDRSTLTAKLELLGAKVSGSVSKRTATLVAGREAGSKLVDATRLGIEVWDEPRLLAELARVGG